MGILSGLGALGLGNLENAVLYEKNEKKRKREKSAGRSKRSGYVI